jgi:hypothetical protein
MVLTSRRDVTFMTVRGPQTWATELQYSADLEWFGIRFRLGTLMPYLPPGLLSDGRDANLPHATGSSFWLHNAAWPFPNFDNADDFVRRLERAGLLTYDPVVQAAWARARVVRPIGPVPLRACDRPDAQHDRSNRTRAYRGSEAPLCCTQCTSWATSISHT